MKILPAFAASLLLFGSTSLVAEEGTTARSITVSGTAEKSLPANRIEISVRIRSVQKTLSEAQEASKAVFSTVAETLGKLDIPEEKLELTNHTLGRETRHNRDGETIEVGFYSNRNFNIELDDTSLLEVVYEELAKNPDLQVGGTSFQRKDKIELRKELRKEALEAAKEKATEMANVYGLYLGKVMKISESGSTPFSPMAYNTRNVASMEAGSSVEGRVNLTASVAVVFELVD